VVQDLAHLLDEFHPLFGGQVGIGELVYQVQKLFALVIAQWFAVLAIIRLCRWWSNLQPLLYPLHGSIVVLDYRLVVDPGIDHRRIQPFVAQELLDRGHPAAGATEQDATREKCTASSVRAQVQLLLRNPGIPTAPPLLLKVRRT
jgi:hypothetical protein